MLSSVMGFLILFIFILTLLMLFYIECILVNACIIAFKTQVCKYNIKLIEKELLKRKLNSNIKRRRKRRWKW